MELAKLNIKAYAAKDGDTWVTVFPIPIVYVNESVSFNII